MTIAIITDSSSDIPTQLANSLGITTIPCHVAIGNIDYKDGVDLNSETFFELLQTASDFPRTSQPTIAEFITVYENHLNYGHEIISLHVSRKLSGTLNAAIQAKSLLGDPKNIRIIDSRLASLALGLVVLQAAKLAMTTPEVAKVHDMIISACQRSRCFVVLDTLKYLHRGGRIGKAHAFVGGVLNVKPILKLSEGEVEPVERPRSIDRALTRVSSLVKAFSPISDLGIIYSTNTNNVETLKQSLSEIDSPTGILITRFGATLGTYVGPESIGVAFISSP
jgi:DegV family protein with EDD domain